MAIGQKTGGRNFPKGNRLGGRPSLPEDLKNVKKFTKTEVEALISKYMRLDLTEINKVIKNPKTKAIDGWVCSIIKFGILKGDPLRLSFLFDRLVGRPTGEKKVIEVRRPQLTDQQEWEQS